MKKIKLKESDLRRIIRRVITETSPTNVYRKWQGQLDQNGNCKPSGILNFHFTPGGGQSNNTPQQNNDAWVAMGSPSPGEFVKGEGTTAGGIQNTACWKYLGTSLTPQSGPNGSSSYYSHMSFITLTNCNDCFVSTPTGGCDTTAWSNYNTWVSNWTNSGPFNSQNQNQPCTHICKQINKWTNKLTNVGTTQVNQLNCKIDEGNNQSQIHGCNC